jgi:hypothetical protein
MKYGLLIIQLFVAFPSGDLVKERGEIYKMKGILPRDIVDWRL